MRSRRTPPDYLRWPGIFTVIGQRDMCGRCYWLHRDLLEQFAAFFAAEHAVR